MDTASNKVPAVARTVAVLRRAVAPWRAGGNRIALVPTMGALHEAHIALVRAAASRAGRVVVSIFVNPTQFAPTEDLDAYPRNEGRDLAMLAGTGADLIFAPSVAEMYPAGFATSVHVAGPAVGLESDSRPHFFGGVATVVAKLLLSCLPDIALFGEKDYQQLLVIRRMVSDLTIPTEIVGLPTVRAADGLALSSRNAYLSEGERRTAPRLHAALGEAAAAIRHGEPGEAVLRNARAELATAGFLVDYLEFRNAETLAPIASVATEPGRLLVAARLGKTRLIDNIPV